MNVSLPDLTERIGSVLAVQQPPSLPSIPPAPSASPTASLLRETEQINSLGDALELIRETLQGLLRGFVSHLPLIALSVVILGVGVVVARLGGRWTERGLRRTSADEVAMGLTVRLVRFVIVVAFLLLALSITGVNIGVALAGLGIAGLALAFALQNILENFVAGLFLLVRKPFRAGDQIQTGDVEGTVREIDLRTTAITGYDGISYLVPNSDVFRNVLVNFTRRGRRRTSVFIAVDYRDDHTEAFDVIREAVTDVDGVLDDREPEILLAELADSGVSYEIRFWARPQQRNVRHVESRVLTAAKTAVEAAGMTVPWPIRTLSFDNTLSHTRRDDGAAIEDGGDAAGGGGASGDDG